MLVQQQMQESWTSCASSCLQRRSRRQMQRQKHRQPLKRGSGSMRLRRPARWRRPPACANSCKQLRQGLQLLQQQMLRSQQACASSCKQLKRGQQWQQRMQSRYNFCSIACRSQRPELQLSQQRSTKLPVCEQLWVMEAKFAAATAEAEAAVRDRALQHAAAEASAAEQVATLRQQLQSTYAVAKVQAQAMVSFSQQLQDVKARAEATAAAAAEAIRGRDRQHEAAAITAAQQVETLCQQLQGAETRAAAAAAEAEHAMQKREEQHAAAEAILAEQVAHVHQQLQAVESKAAAATAEAERAMEQREQQHAAAATSAAEQAASLCQQAQSSTVAHAQAMVTLTQQLQDVKARAEATATAAAEAIRGRDRQHEAAAITAAQQVETLCQQLQGAETRAAAAAAEAEHAMQKREEQHAAAEAILAEQVAHLRQQLQGSARAHAQVLDDAREQLQAMEAGAAAAADLVQECQSAWQQASSSKAAVQDVHSALCAALTDSRSTTLTADVELPEGNLEGLSLQQLVAAIVQDSKSAKQSALSLHNQLQQSHAVLATCLNSLSSTAAAERAGSGGAAAGDSQALQLQQLAAVLVQRCESAEQQAASRQAQLQEACSILHAAQRQCPGVAAAPAAAPAEPVSEDGMPLQQLAAGLVASCLACQQGADAWRQQVQEDLAELQAAWAKVGRPAALRGKCPSGKCKEFWELQTVRAQLVEAELKQARAEQKAAACAWELEHTRQDMSAVRLQLAEAAPAPAAEPSVHPGQQQVWLPERAATVAAGVLGVMALIQLASAAGTATASGPQARSQAGLKLAFTQSARRRLVRVPACESPAAMLRLLLDTSVQHKQGAGQAPLGQCALSPGEAAAAGAVTLREASLGAAEYALWRSVTLAADAGARARQQFDARPKGAVSAEGLRECITDLQRCQHGVVVAAGELMLHDFLLVLSRQHLHVCQTGWLQLPMPSSEVVQKLLAEAAPVSDVCVVAAEELQAALSSLDAQDAGAPQG